MPNLVVDNTIEDEPQLEFDFKEDQPHIYVAGPMSGYENFNHPTFNKVSEKFTEEGWNVFNPAAFDLVTYGSIERAAEAYADNKQEFLRYAMGIDLGWIAAKADAIAMLPGWENSKGARAEHALAVVLDIPIFYITL